MNNVHVPQWGGTIVTNNPPTPWKIYKQLSAVMKDIGPVTKDQKNVAQGYKFRGIDQFVNALHPALVRHGVVMVTNVLNRQETIKEVTRSNGKAGVDKHVNVTVSYTFYAEDGSAVTSTMVGEGVDSGDKATNKALSAALKYALIQTFSIPTEDLSDGDLESPELGSEKKKQAERATQPEGQPTTSSTVTDTAPKKSSSFRAKAAVTKAPEPEKRVFPIGQDVGPDEQDGWEN